MHLAKTIRMWPKKFTIFENSSELVNYIENCSDIVTTDTSCLHLGSLFRRNLFLYGRYVPRFVPLNFNHKNYIASPYEFKKYFSFDFDQTFMLCRAVVVIKGKNIIIT